MSYFKAELSNKNDFKISKHRYYELQHFCLQYPEWVRAADDLLNKSPDAMSEKYGKSNNISDPVAFAAEKREKYLKKIKLVDDVCKEANPEIAHLLKAIVTIGTTYDKLEARLGTLPISRVSFYKYYRKVYWLLDGYL